MATIPILTINQRTEDGAISLNTNLPNPLLVLDLLLTVQRSVVEQCARTLEPKKESTIITGEQGKVLLT